jgi:hypothetical protein
MECNGMECNGILLSMAGWLVFTYSTQHGMIIMGTVLYCTELPTYNLYCIASHRIAYSSD